MLYVGIDYLVAKIFSGLENLWLYGLYLVAVHLFAGTIEEQFKRKQYKCRHL